MIVSIQLFATIFMALYAVDNGDLIHAADALMEKTYCCIDCFGPVRRRRGKFPHFYHVKEVLGCRLYSKSQDHLAAQLEVKKKFPPGVLEMEKPFMTINRVADLCWQKEKIVFEIQCSQITEKEVESRICDYRSIGYDVVWLLDDRRYNKRIPRPAEEFLRNRCGYFLSVRTFEIYDQFELFFQGKRVRMGRPLNVDLTRVFRKPVENFSHLPKQIFLLKGDYYFFGDRMSLALRFPLKMLEQKGAEASLRRPSKIGAWFKKNIREPYVRFIERMVKKC